MKFTETNVPDRYKTMEDKELSMLYMEEDDQQAIVELMNRHKDHLYFYILSIVGSEQDAEDVFQNTFLKVFTKMNDTYEEQGKWIAWVSRIAYNASIDHIRREKRKGSRVDKMYESPDDLEPQYFERFEDEDQINAQDNLEFKELKKRILKYIHKLPEEQRQVLMLRHFYGMRFKEISKLMDTSINTALGRMRYARTNLKKMFDKDDESEEVLINSAL